MNACRRRHRTGNYNDLDLPWSDWKCNEQSNQMECRPNSDGNTGVDSIIGYPVTQDKKASGLWCEVNIPPPEWSLKSCPISGGQNLVKVLTYNLFWWNLFNKHHGGERSAGRLIARTGGPEKYDIMGFQECEDVWRVLHDAELDDSEYDAIDGGRAIAVAWRKSKWTKLAHDSVDVGEDSRDQYYGKRSAMWVRLRNNQDGKTVFFVNHHGPLKVSQGGGCTGSANALNIVKLIAENAHGSDLIILVGDFNAAQGSTRVTELERRLDHVQKGRIFGGVDHIFSNCGSRGHDKSLEGRRLLQKRPRGNECDLRDLKHLDKVHRARACHIAHSFQRRLVISR